VIQRSEIQQEYKISCNNNSNNQISIVERAGNEIVAAGKKRMIGLFNCVVSRDVEALRLLFGCSVFVVVIVVELLSRHRHLSRAIRPSFHQL
jgi:hypothetical protein